MIIATEVDFLGWNILFCSVLFRCSVLFLNSDRSRHPCSVLFMNSDRSRHLFCSVLEFRPVPTSPTPGLSLCYEARRFSRGMRMAPI